MLNDPWLVYFLLKTQEKFNFDKKQATIGQERIDQVGKMYCYLVL